MPTETEAVVSFLEEKERKEGKLPEFLEFYLKLSQVQYPVERKLASRLEPSLSREAISERINGGTILISFEELVLDPQLLAETFDEVKIVFAKYAGIFKSQYNKLAELKAGSVLTKPVIKQWYEKQKLTAKVVPKGSATKLISSIIHATLKPFLLAHAKTLKDSFDQERWRRNRCPICGGSADFAFMDTERGLRWLACARCDTEWPFQRLQCPYCNSQNQDNLSYYTDDSGLYRLYTCEHCKHYLKIIDLRQTESPIILQLERFYTLDMDRQAIEMGYKP